MFTIDHLKHRRRGFGVGIISHRGGTTIRATWTSPVDGATATVDCAMSKELYSEPAAKAEGLRQLASECATRMDAEDAAVENAKALTAAKKAAIFETAAATIGAREARDKVGKPKKWAEIKDKKGAK